MPINFGSKRERDIEIWWIRVMRKSEKRITSPLQYSHFQAALPYELISLDLIQAHFQHPGKQHKLQQPQISKTER